jgi:DNA-binding sugar fermentation-stimulating protein
MNCSEIVSSTKQQTLLYKLENLVKCKIIKRPSRHIRSPYVADIVIYDTNKKTYLETEYLGHTASLGCCGLVEKDSICYAIKLDGRTKCDYRIILSETYTKNHITNIGVYPKLAEEIAGKAIRCGLIKNLNAETITREKYVMNSRFDFMGKIKNSNQYYILEVKNVPLANFEDAEKKILNKMDFSNREWNDKIAYFPDGYRKKKTDTVSPRAVKHIQELQKIKELQPQIRCILLFVIQRDDVSRFQPSIMDPIYRKAVQLAETTGVEINTLQVSWKNGCCHFMNNNLPLYIHKEFKLNK